MSFLFVFEEKSLFEMKEPEVMTEYGRKQHSSLVQDTTQSRKNMVENKKKIIGDINRLGVENKKSITVGFICPSILTL